jgi:cyanophycinase
MVAALERAGARNVRVLPARELKDVDDPKNLDVLRQAKGIWFDGGRQWRYVDAYEGTRAEELFRDVLRRGGVIGGSSAGASIQADYLVRGSPLGNMEMMSEGYERGLGFLPGVAVDQHFSQRKRFPDMTAVVKTFPQLLGIGIDEATALVVQGHTGEVLGRGKVYFYDRGKPVKEGEPDYEAVPAGGRYDLKERRVPAAK